MSESWRPLVSIVFLAWYANLFFWAFLTVNAMLSGVTAWWGLSTAGLVAGVVAFFVYNSYMNRVRDELEDDVG